jgi:hypothetical protein
MTIFFKFSAAFAACATLTVLAAQVRAETPTNGTAEQWKAICAEKATACSYIRTQQGMETYHVCAQGKCYAVLCNTHSPDAICLKDELSGRRPPPRKIQAGIFGLL